MFHQCILFGLLTTHPTVYLTHTRTPHLFTHISLRRLNFFLCIEMNLSVNDYTAEQFTSHSL